MTATAKDLDGFGLAQVRARTIAQEFAGGIEAGMSEADAYARLDRLFRESSVKAHWHRPVVGFGFGTLKIRSLSSIAVDRFLRAGRRISPGDLIMVDIAPVIEGYPSDYTLTTTLGEATSERTRLIKAARSLADAVAEELRLTRRSGEIYRWAEDHASDTGPHRLIHVPIIGLGHQILKIPLPRIHFSGARFVYLAAVPGVSFIGGRRNQELRGMWMIEPYVGGYGRAAKFEQMVLLEGSEALRLNAEGPIPAWEGIPERADRAAGRFCEL